MKTLKKSKLEKKAEKVGNIWKTYYPYTPFAIFRMNNNDAIKYHGSTNNSNAAGMLTSFVNTVFVMGYLAFSLLFGTPNFTKWSEIGQTRIEESYIKRQSFKKDVLDKTYNYLDSNSDGVLSKEEFRLGIEKIEKSHIDDTKFYDMLNNELRQHTNDYVPSK